MAHDICLTHGGLRCFRRWRFSLSSWGSISSATDCARRPMSVASPLASREDDAVILAVRDLRLAFAGLHGPVEALRGVSLHVRRGEKVALVGESGSGKSTIARLVLGLLQDHAAEISGSAFFGRREIVGDES